MATLVIEWFYSGNPVGTPQEVAVTGTALAGGSRITVPRNLGSPLFARLSASGSSIIVSQGTNPTASATEGILVPEGQSRDIRVYQGQLLSAVTTSLQATGNTSLASIDSKLPASLGTSGGLKTELFASDGTSVDFSGITTVFRLLSATADTNSNNVKASSGRIFKIQGVNAAAAIRYLKLYNKASAPTVGTDIPVATLQIPASSAFDFNFASGLYFATGIGIGMTTAAADNSTAALTAGDITCLNLYYA